VLDETFLAAGGVLLLAALVAFSLRIRSRQVVEKAQVP